MTPGDVALYSALALLGGMVVGLAWGGVLAFVRALLN